MGKAVVKRALLLLLVLLCLGCPESLRQAQARTADAVAISANASLPILIDRFRRDGLDAIEKVKEVGGTAEDARHAIAEVEDQWKPIWGAWEALRLAQDYWASAIELGGDTGGAILGLRDAYCTLRRMWPATVPASPLSVVRCSQP